MQGSFRKSELAAIDTIEVADPLTIKLHLKSPFSPLIAQLTDRAGMMVSPKAAKEAGDKFGLKPVCAGPYKFVERVQQDRIVVEKFADYWNKDNVHIDKITYLPIVDSTVRLANLRSGGLDLLERLNATDMASVKGDSKLKLNELPDLSYFGLTINLANGDKAKNPLGQNAKVREALNLAIDREALNQVVFNGEFVPGNQWVSPTNAYYQKSLPIPKRDVAKAKALIKEAGVPTPITVDFMVPQGAENKAVSEVVQAMAAEAGFDLKIRVTEFATSLKQAEQGEYQMYFIGWSGRTDPDGNIYIFEKSKAPQNVTHFSNPEVDKALDDARLTSDVAKRKAIYEKAAKILLTENPILYLYHRKVLIAQTTKLDGFVPVPDGLVRVVGLKLK
jgi:peptide/nickel transport system substrate-binding protein